MDDPEEESLPKFFHERATALPEDAEKSDALEGVGDREDDENTAPDGARGRGLERRKETSRRKEPDGADHALADVDNNNTDCEEYSLRPQSIRASSIAAAHGSDVHASS